MDEIIKDFTEHLSSPAFEGTYEFDLTMEALGERFVRRLRAEYKWTPEWEYWDLKKRAPVTRTASSQIGFELLTVADPQLPENDQDEADDEDRSTTYFDDEDDPAPPAWVHIDLVSEGALPWVVWENLHDAIDEQCKAEDRKRRELAK